MLRLSFHRLAVCELDEAVHYYESRSTGLGTVFVNAVEACAESIRALPNSGRVMRGKIRRRLVRGFPCAIVYKTHDPRSHSRSCHNAHEAKTNILGWPAITEDNQQKPRSPGQRGRCHRWVSTAPETFRDFVSWLADGGYSAIALRDLGRYLPAPAPPADPYAARRRRHGTRFGPPHLR